MGITVLHIENCPNVALVRGRLTEALDRVGLTATVGERLVVDDDDAAALKFRGVAHDPHRWTRPVSR